MISRSPFRSWCCMDLPSPDEGISSKSSMETKPHGEGSSQRSKKILNHRPVMTHGTNLFGELRSLISLKIGRSVLGT